MLNEDLLNDLNSVPEIAQTLALTKESGYTKAELETYDKYWDSIRVEKTLIADAEAKGEQIGIQKGEQIGIQKNKIEMVITLHEDEIPIDQIAKYTKLSVQGVMKILMENGR